MHRVAKWSGWRKGRKYSNVPRDYRGHQYQSTFEAQVARDLDLRMRAGELVTVARQVKVALTAHGRHVCDYWIDFLVTHKDGTREYIEAKGFATDVWRLKWKLFEAQMAEEEPQARLTIIKK